MTIRKLGKCKDCGEPLPEGYGDDLHDCPKAPKPITGWVAWHPERKEKDMVEVFLTEDMAENTLCLREGFYESGKFYAGVLCPEEAYQAGWKVRPVEMRFTDEGEG